MRQIVRLDAGSRRLEFHTTVDWHESHTLLKVCFPLAVRAPNATYEMPFGYAERPTHYSTSFDRARYEVPGHRFADLSEHGFGAAVLTRLEVRLQLLRRRPARVAAALVEEPRPRGRHGTARVRVRARPARRRLARGRDRARGRALQRAAPLDARRARTARSRRSTTRTSCSTRSSAPRTRTRSCCGCTRRTAARGVARVRRRGRRSRRRGARTCSRTTATRSTSTAARSSCRTGRTRS